MAKMISAKPHLPKCGMIKTSESIMAPDGKCYSHWFCRDWRFTTDTTFPVEKFRSSEHWQLWAYRNNKCVAMFPGCQVKGFIYVTKRPTSTEKIMAGDWKGFKIECFDLSAGRHHGKTRVCNKEKSKII